MLQCIFIFDGINFSYLFVTSIRGTLHVSEIKHRHLPQWTRNVFFESVFEKHISYVKKTAFFHRINCKVLLLTSKAANGLAPVYRTDLQEILGHHRSS